MESASQPTVSNETIAATYDRFASLYDWFVAPMEARTRQRALDLLSIAPSERIVELGCGPGYGLVSLAGFLDQTGHVVGLDAAPGVLDRSRSRAMRPAVSERIDLVLGDARSLPIAEDSVAVIFIEDTLELFSRGEIRAVLQECKRVLTPDGRVGVITMERETVENDPFIRAYEWVFDHVPGYERIGCRPIYARQALEAAGFTIERREHHRRGYIWPVEILIGHPTCE
ncbi:MAG: class I SAM-dependent methyltransferase [Halodesulfurarchaeum sp.]